MCLTWYLTQIFNFFNWKHTAHKFHLIDLFTTFNRLKCGASLPSTNIKLNVAGWREVSGYHEIKQDCEPAFLHSVSNFLYHTSLPHIFWDISDVPVMGAGCRKVRFTLTDIFAQSGLKHWQMEMWPQLELGNFNINQADLNLVLPFSWKTTPSEQKWCLERKLFVVMEIQFARAFIRETWSFCLLSKN